MRKGTLFTSRLYLGNKQFDIDRQARDDCLAMFRRLRERFAEEGIDLSTQDINPPEKSEFVIFNDNPGEAERIQHTGNTYLLLLESTIIKPENWIPAVHRSFRKVFTWHDDFIDGSRYFKVNYSFDLSFLPDLTGVQRKTPFTLIAANKKAHHPLELYSERLRTVRWFENEHPGEFALYGIGWDRRYFTPPLSFLNRFSELTKAMASARPSWAGSVASKGEVLKESIFSFCYENAKNIPGYITEKMFDALIHGCIPIYWGAGNVTDYVPSGAFIDRRHFDRIDQLYNFLVELSENEKNQIQLAGREFLGSPKAGLFTTDSFAEVVAAAIMEDTL